MEQESIDKNEYPMRIDARRLHLYIRRDCPSIVFFDKFKDENHELARSIILISKKYPRVFCYKVGWKPHQYYYQTINPSEKHDVTVWQSSQKIRVIQNPDICELEDMFSYVQNKIDGSCRKMYLMILKYDNQISKKVEETKVDRVENKIGNFKNPKEQSFLIHQASQENSSNIENLSKNTEKMISNIEIVPNTEIFQDISDFEFFQRNENEFFSSIDTELFNETFEIPDIEEASNILISPKPINNVFSPLQYCDNIYDQKFDHPGIIPNRLTNNIGQSLAIKKPFFHKKSVSKIKGSCNKSSNMKKVSYSENFKISKPLSVQKYNLNNQKKTRDYYSLSLKSALTFKMMKKRIQRKRAKQNNIQS